MQSNSYWAPLFYRSDLGIEHDVFVHSDEELNMYVLSDPDVKKPVRLYKTQCIHLPDETDEDRFDPWYVASMEEFLPYDDGIEDRIIQSVREQSEEYNTSPYCRTDDEKVNVTHIYYPLFDSFFDVNEKEIA